MSPPTASEKTGLRILRRRRHRAAGTSLLLTLVVLSAIVVLLVMLSRLVTVERRVTQGYSELLRAEMAAKPSPWPKDEQRESTRPKRC